MSKVLVACKLPNGLICRIHRMEDISEPVMGGGFKTIKKAVFTGRQFELAGPAVPFGVMPENPAVHGYALTPVEKEDWDEWVAQNPDSDVLLKGHVFAHEKRENVMAQAKEQRKDGVATGLEPLDPKNLRAAGLVPANPNLETSTADEQPAMPVQRGGARPDRVARVR